jgi:hypothetical protein
MTRGLPRARLTKPDARAPHPHSEGSIRTDVILRNEIGDPIAIYDAKTGDAELRPDRIKDLREKVGAGPDIPVIELHVTRGVRVKGKMRIIAATRRATRRYGEF